MNNQRTIDHRFAPSNSWTNIGRPDDKHKTIVSETLRKAADDIRRLGADAVPVVGAIGQFLRMLGPAVLGRPDLAGCPNVMDSPRLFELRTLPVAPEQRQILAPPMESQHVWRGAVPMGSSHGGNTPDSSTPPLTQFPEVRRVGKDHRRTPEPSPFRLEQQCDRPAVVADRDQRTGKLKGELIEVLRC